MNPIVTGVHDDAGLRESFHELTRIVFEFDLAGWDAMGCWDERYTPHVIVEQGRVVANVSTTHHRMQIGGEDVVAIQIGTVMTHPDLRGKGLASELMAHVIDRYRTQAEWMFLYCDTDLFPFYGRAGFQVVPEVQFERKLTHQNGRLTKMEPVRLCPHEPESVHNPAPAGGRDSGRLVDLANPLEIDFLRQKLAARTPVSERFSVLDGAELWLYHAAYRFSGDIRYIEELDTVVIARKRECQLQIIDVVAPRPLALTDLLPYLPADGCDTLAWHFTPDLIDPDCPAQPWSDEDGTLVLGDASGFPSPFRRQETSMA